MTLTTPALVPADPGDPLAALLAGLHGADNLEARIVGRGQLLGVGWNPEMIYRVDGRAWMIEDPPAPDKVVEHPNLYMEAFGGAIEADPRPWCVWFTHVPKVPGEVGGWRWHKWADYFGPEDRQPSTEYLADEPPGMFDDGVYTACLHLVLEAAS